MKKLIAIAIVSTATIMSSFSASNEDYYNVTSDEEADLLKKANETTVYSRPFIDKRKIISKKAFIGRFTKARQYYKA